MALLFISFLPKPAHGQILKIEVTDYGWLDILPPLKLLLDNYLLEEERKMNDDQPIKDPQRLMKGTANSNALAAKGVGSHYTSDMKKFMVGAAVGVGADLEKDKAIEDEVSGAAAATGFMLGTRMDLFGTNKILGLEARRLSSYVNFGRLNHLRKIPGDEDVDILADLDALNIGIHFRYELIDGDKHGLFRWGGIKTHTGYEYNKNELVLETEIDRVLELDSGSGVLNGRITGKPKYTIDSEVHSIPLEISTDVTLLNALTLFGGLGADWNMGGSRGKGRIDGDVSPLACSGAVCVSGDPFPQLKVVADLDASEPVDPFTLRAFGGVQLDAGSVHLFGQVNKVFGNKVTGASAGLRITF